MSIEQLEYYLNRGNTFGYNTQTSQENIGWVIVSKQFPIERFFERFDESDNPSLFREQLKIKYEPYQVWVGELTAEVYERDKLPSNEDYIVNATYTFTSLVEVELLLKELQLDLSDIKWSSEIEYL